MAKCGQRLRSQEVPGFRCAQPGYDATSGAPQSKAPGESPGPCSDLVVRSYQNL
jgi:hypothetical protein